MSNRRYASLTGPLLGLYYPLPFVQEDANRAALNSSRLKSLWCDIYSAEQADELIKQFGGRKLENVYAQQLDYASAVVHKFNPQLV
jgi:hypothetical protein